MKKIKSAVDYIQLSKLSWKSNILQVNIVEEWIKQAQLDMLEHAVNKCLSNAYAEESRIGYVWEVNEQSILKTIDEIKKELKYDKW